MRGLNSGNLLYDSTVIVNATGPTLFTFNYLGIDQLIFESSGGVQASGLSSVTPSHAFRETMLHLGPVVAGVEMHWRCVHAPLRLQPDHHAVLFAGFGLDDRPRRLVGR